MERYDHQIHEKKQLVMSTSFRGRIGKPVWVPERVPLVAGFLIAAITTNAKQDHNMFSSTKRVNEHQLIAEVKQLLGKYVTKHSKQTESISDSTASLFMPYVYIYTYIAQREIWDNCGMLKGLSAGNLLIDTLIADVAKGASNDDDSKTVEKQQRDIYEKISSRLHKANASDGDNEFSITLVANEAMTVVAEKASGKRSSDLGAEGFNDMSRFLIVTKQCSDFDTDISKLLSKRELV